MALELWNRDSLRDVCDAAQYATVIMQPEHQTGWLACCEFMRRQFGVGGNNASLGMDKAQLIMVRGPRVDAGGGN